MIKGINLLTNRITENYRQHTIRNFKEKGINNVKKYWLKLRNGYLFLKLEK